MGFLDAIRKRRTLVPQDDWSSPRPVPEVSRVIEGKRYTTLDAKVIAQGPIFGILPTYGWLLQTNKNNFFVVLQFIGGMSLTPYVHEEAIKMYSNFAFQEVPFESAFPDVQVTDA